MKLFLLAELVDVELVNVFVTVDLFKKKHWQSLVIIIMKNNTIYTETMILVIIISRKKCVMNHKGYLLFGIIFYNHKQIFSGMLSV